MKLMRSVATILLLLFVVATVGTLIAQEVVRSEHTAVPGNEPDLSLENDNTGVAGQSPDETAASPIERSELPELPEGSSAEHGILDDTAVPEVPTQDVVAEAEAACVIEAVYFHNTHRCVTCLKIEGDAKAIVEEVFAEELAAGTLRWSTINMEDNPALSVQYNLASPSLVLLRKSGDQVVDWVLLEETWALVRSTTRYSAYIIESFSTFLEGCL
jgi:hypothetical protein